MGIVREIRRHFTAYVFAVLDPETGSWEAYCPEFDVVTCGDNALHALQMIHEAVGIVLADCLTHGEDPHAPSTDLEVWARLDFLLLNSSKVDQAQPVVDLTKVTGVTRVDHWTLIGTEASDACDDASNLDATSCTNSDFPLSYVV